MADEGGKAGLQSVSRALRAIELIGEAGELGVTELGRRLGVHKATASRLAATLAEHGFVRRDPDSDRYRLGFRLVALAGAAMADLDLVRAARPVVVDLAERTRETVNVGVLSGDEVIYLDQASGARSIVSVSWVGRRTPLHATAAGKVLLAFADQAERDSLLRGPLSALTPRTIVDRRALAEQLATVRERGYAQTFEELELGLNAIAAPIRGAGRRAVAALSVSGPAFRVRPEEVALLGRLVLDAATAVSRRLGFAGGIAD
ncbi:MAG TPA: IclR family transcriptional regulator [Actinomycetota bacterium]|nr:IclR family transcriptional regulator [Actinomycetota bacterium]